MITNDIFMQKFSIFSYAFTFLRFAFAGNLMAVSLVEAMLRRDPLLRPTSATLATHPFFWSNERQLRFFMVSILHVFYDKS